jgi:hypothetical protein
VNGFTRAAQTGVQVGRGQAGTRIPAERPAKPVAPYGC